MAPPTLGGLAVRVEEREDVALRHSGSEKTGADEAFSLLASHDLHLREVSGDVVLQRLVQVFYKETFSKQLLEGKHMR